MKRVLLLVEGQTEETFVKTVLAPYFWAFETAIEVTRVVTKRVQGRRAYRGGCLNYSQVKADLQRLLSSNPAAVTTLFDYYALPDDFPGRRSLRESASCFDRVAHLEAELARSVGDPRFIPNIVLHEFEGLLFSMPSEIAKVLLADARAAELEAIAAAHASPEEIDEGPETHPSKRITRLLPEYQKALHGPQIAARIGLQAIRARCRHFAAWLGRMEGL